MSDKFDYVIVGAGAAGCVLAARLSEDAGNRVLLVEAGGWNKDWRFRVPGAAGLAGLVKAANWGWVSEIEPGLNGRSVVLSQGRGIGGSGAINGLVLIRGQSDTFDRWKNNGCEGWSFEDVLPYFRRSERNTRGENRWHGGHGEMVVQPSRNPLAICKLFLQAAAEAKFPIVDDFNSEVGVGFGFYDINVGNGRRSSTSLAFLAKARKRPNLEVWTSARVNRVIVENNAATGVEIVHNGAVRIVHAGAEVVLCAGTIESPRILMASGIGDSSELSALGIKPISESPEVGRNLQNHPIFALSFICSEPVTGQVMAQPLRAIKEGLHYMYNRGGLLGDGIFPVGGVFALDEGSNVPDVQVSLMPMLLLQAGMGAPTTLTSLLRQPHGFLVAVNIGAPASRGKVSLRSADPRDPAKIQLNIYDDPSDLQRMLKAVRKTRRIMQQPSLAKVIASEISPGADADGDELLAQRLRNESSTMYHQCGTCRMGGDNASVVDTKLRVRGIGRLRIADASIVPIIPNANTYAVTLMIAERAADFIRERVAVFD